jgi:hypothetical protein
MRVFSLQLLSETFLILRITERDMARILSYLTYTWIFTTKLEKPHLNAKFN